MQLAQLGELGLIRRLEAALQGQVAGRNILGVGDDAAAFPPPRTWMLATTDSLVEGADFRLGQVSWADLGWKSLAVNLSDIAAMGGVPQYALVALCLPASVEVSAVDALYQGMLEAARSFGVTIVGGDLSASTQVVITVTLLGSQPEGWDGYEGLMRRDGARPGQQVAVTGALGTSAAGLRMLTRGERFDAETEALLRRSHFRPQPRISEGQALLRAGVRCAIDISDGLLRDLGHIGHASGVDVVIQADLLPVSEAVRRAYPRGWQELALAGGEDFELLCAAAPTALERARREMDTPLTVIGHVTGPGSGRITVLDAEGRELHLERAGWDHFLS